MPGTFFVGSFKREPKGSRYPLTNLNFLVGLHARLLFVLVLSRLNEVIHSNGRLYLVFEWLQKDLKRYMDSANGSLDLKRAKVSEVRFSIFHFIYGMLQIMLHGELQSYLYQVLKGLDFCHSRGVMHRDMKPQNLLVDDHGSIKIADFGLARAFMIPVRPYTHEVR